jgi:acetylornithine deacetylase/succinyl-diaminopimelate desuccinylase-like protein
MHRRARTAAVAAALALFVGGSAAPAAQAQQSEVVSLLQELVRVNTSNPPGNEAMVAELLRAKLEPLGFQVEVLPTPAPGKAHLIARLPATQPSGEKPLLLAGHADVVGVERPLWTVDPFAAVIQGDRLYGRGAMDFKGGLAAFTVAAMRLARDGGPRTRDLVLLSEADEEGGAYGTTWLAENHWDKIDASESINEGGWVFAGGRGGARLMGITTIDKNSLSVTFRTRGTSTHSSRPLPDSALRRLARALNRVEHYDTAPTITPAARTYLRAWARVSSGRTARRLRAITTTRRPAVRRRLANRLRDGRYGELFDGLVRNIFVPTIVSGGFRANVLPGTAEATVNMRMLPGQKPRPLIRELERAVDDPRVEITPIVTGDATVEETLDAFDKRAGQPASRIDTDLFRSLVAEGERTWPGVEVTPALFEAGTDATPWRQRGIPVYGIYPYPISLGDLQAMHGNDERVPIRGLEQGTDMLTRVVADAVR